MEKIFILIRSNIEFIGSNIEWILSGFSLAVISILFNYLTRYYLSPKRGSITITIKDNSGKTMKTTILCVENKNDIDIAKKIEKAIRDIRGERFVESEEQTKDSLVL